MEGQMRRAITTVALALSLVGCGSNGPPEGEPFELVTSWEPGTADFHACRPGWWAAGRLVVDPKRGTALQVEDGDYFVKKGDMIRVLWWPTYTGRRIGNEVMVLDPHGRVVATTGQRYRIQGSFERVGFVACGSQVTPALAPMSRKDR